MNSEPTVKKQTYARLFMIMLSTLMVGILLTRIFNVTTCYCSVFRGNITLLHILIATGILLILDFFRGMAFPLGMKIASTKSASLTPWLWGINGATLVCASVFAVAIALSSSISLSF